MKRLLLALLILALLAAAATLWGNSLLGRTLDAELAPRLSKQLGLPVTLGPITAHLLQLKVRSPKLIMGDAQDPAIVATDVEVTLAWKDLLEGKVRLVKVRGTDLMVRPSRWPSSDTPPPADYEFLEPWLPRSLQLASGRLVSAKGDEYPIRHLLWQRLADGSARARWEEAHGVTLRFGARVKSLPDLLRLAPSTLALNVQAAGKPDSRITVDASVQPDTAAAYAVHADIQAATLTAQVTAYGQEPWSLPDRSETTIPVLDFDQLQKLAESYSAPETAGAPGTGLATVLPAFDLPAHHGRVAIKEFRINDEIGRDTAFEFITGEQGLQISGLTIQGPTGLLNGELSIGSSPAGWTVDMDAALEARDLAAGAMLPFAGADWLWRTGHAKLSGSGATLDALLNSLAGDIALEGQYHGTVDLPVSMTARLDTRPEQFALDQVTVSLGEGQLSGSATLSNTSPRTLTLDVKGTQLDLGSLFPAETAEPQPGIGVPRFLGSWPALDLNVAVSLDALQAPGLNLRQAKATLQRTAQGGRFVASANGANFGSLNITLDATLPANAPRQFQLAADFKELDLADLFRQSGVINSRSTGSLTLHSQGGDMQAIFAAMRGQARLTTEVRADNNWRRRPIAEETLALSGNASLILTGERIVGVKIEKLNIDSIDQDLTGDLTLTSDREPWLVADLKSDRLNITGLQALLPASTQQADQAGLVPSLERLGATQVSLNAQSLTVQDFTVSNALIKLSSKPNIMTINQLDFTSRELNLRTAGKLTWKGNRATLESTAQLADVNLDKFLINSADVPIVPVSGTVQLASEGSRIEELLRNATGTIDLRGNTQAPNNSPASRRRLAVTASRLDDGVQAVISSLQWGESELTGSVRYHHTTPPTLDVELQGGTLSLLPWENAHLSGRRRPPEQTARTDLDTIARDSADAVESLLLAPLRFLRSDDTAPPRTRVFSTDPISLDALKSLNVSAKGQLDALVSTELNAGTLAFNTQIRNGVLDAKASSGQFGGGSGELALRLDSTATPPAFTVSSTFHDVRGIQARATFPRSGFISLQTRGQSEAELAANASGLVYLEMGRGPFDYANSAFLTANLLTTLFQTLIPGISRNQHQLECGTVLGVFNNGEGNTPYGFAARTNQANLLGHLSVNLRNETMEMNIDSRGRQGLGVSVGSVFSNTVRIRGPLNNPSVVPNPTGIAWRAWAAVATGGMSILGESLLRRVWASDNPCTSVRRIIVENECPTNPIAASSPMVCPKT